MADRGAGDHRPRRGGRDLRLGDGPCRPEATPALAGGGSRPVGAALAAVPGRPRSLVTGGGIRARFSGGGRVVSAGRVHAANGGCPGGPEAGANNARLAVDRHSRCRGACPALGPPVRPVGLAGIFPPSRRVLHRVPAAYGACLRVARRRGRDRLSAWHPLPQE